MGSRPCCRSTPGLAITIPETAKEYLSVRDMFKYDWAEKQKPKTPIRNTVAFVDEGSSNFDTDKIMARIDAMTMKMEAQYKEMKSRTECNHFGGNHSKIVTMMTFLCLAKK
ncbi:hypothetical protein Tco_0687581 [Tanacetum coccineum]